MIFPTARLAHQRHPSTHETHPSTHQRHPSTHQTHPSTHQRHPSTHARHPSTQQRHPSTHQRHPSTDRRNSARTGEVDHGRAVTFYSRKQRSYPSRNGSSAASLCQWLTSSSAFLFFFLVQKKCALLHLQASMHALRNQTVESGRFAVVGE